MGVLLASDIADHLPRAVVLVLRQTFTAESFRAHLANLANDTAARESRERERAALIDRLPAIAIEEARISNAIAAGAGLDALVAKLKALQAEREGAKARLEAIEADERDLRVEADAVDRLVEQWKHWVVLLDQANDDRRAGGELAVIPESALVLARQILKRVLLMPIHVKPSPTHPGVWNFTGAALADGLLRGSVDSDGNTAIRRMGPIAGGSGGFNKVRGLEGPPKPPALGDAPASPGRPSMLCSAVRDYGSAGRA